MYGGRMISFYIASRLENASRVKVLIESLEATGKFCCTYNWTVHGSVQGQGEARYAEVASSEMSGVSHAQVVIVWLPGGRGTHAELGAALVLRKYVLLLYSDDEDLQDGYYCAFYFHPCVRRMKVSKDVDLATAALRTELELWG
jgi:hypothetical protein